MQFIEAHVVYSIDKALGGVLFDSSKTIVHVSMTQKEFDHLRLVVGNAICAEYDGIDFISKSVDIYRDMKSVEKEVDSKKPEAKILADEERKRREKKEKQNGE